MTEVGSDHWVMLSFSALMPTDGFKHTLRCEDGLVINKFQTFIYGAKFYTDQPSDVEITISCNEWINEGTGLSLITCVLTLLKRHKNAVPQTIQLVVSDATLPNNRFERDAPTAGFAACFRAPQAKR
jgi:hypothetical protein